MPRGPFSRRAFLAASGALALAAVVLPGCGSGGGGGSDGPVTIFKLSGRGRRVSNAAKNNAANKRFRTLAAANQGRAHPGDTCRIVPLVVSQAEFQRLFGAGNDAVDLRDL
jgi:hypothetical protein